MRTPLLALVNLIMVAGTFLASGCVFSAHRLARGAALPFSAVSQQRPTDPTPARRPAAGRRSLIWRSC